MTLRRLEPSPLWSHAFEPFTTVESTRSHCCSRIPSHGKTLLTNCRAHERTVSVRNEQQSRKMNTGREEGRTWKHVTIRPRRSLFQRLLKGWWLSTRHRDTRHNNLVMSTRPPFN